MDVLQTFITEICSMFIFVMLV